MCDPFVSEMLRVAVAQICQTIGYHTAQTTPLELLQDILHKFLQEFSRDLRRQVEHYNRTEANLNDVRLTLGNLHINVNEIIDYVHNVDPIAFAIDLPYFPLCKDSSFNFLKPGSKEVLTRPVHIYEYLPPLLPPDTISQCVVPQYLFVPKSIDGKESRHGQLPASNLGLKCSETAIKSDMLLPKSSNMQVSTESGQLSTVIKRMYDDEGMPTRVISSVVMTTGGFLSPAIEGKLPDAIIPDIIERYKGLDVPATISDASVSCETSHVEGFEEKADIKKQTEKQWDLISEKKGPSVVTGNANSANASDEKLAISRNTKNAATTTKKPMPANCHPPTVASKLLKKARKKNSNKAITFQGKLSKLEQLGSTEADSSKSKDSTEKENKKYKKILQKFVKSKKSAIDMTAVVAPAANKNLKDCINPAIVATMPFGLDRQQLEKMLKKQMKHKQKLLKKQLVKDSQKSAFEPLPNECVKMPLEKDINNTKPLIKDDIAAISGVVNSAMSMDTEATTKPYHNLPFAQDTVAVLQNDALKTKATIDSEKASTTGAQALRDEKSSLEIKLSNEPDRSKLNIFKKISKSKNLKSGLLPETQTNDDSGKMLINLPSGTTITPTPIALESDSAMSSLDLAAISKLKDNSVMFYGESSIKTKAVCNVNESADSGAVVEKPKKRGRKPGTKNQAKLPAQDAASTASLKKGRKMKPQANQVVPYPSFVTEPFNLATCNQLPPSALDVAHTAMIPGPIKVRKERKKHKNKAHAMFTMEKNNLNITSSIPSNEQVTFFNKKLLRMDTVIQPAPPLLPLPLNLNTQSQSKLSADNINIPAKMTSNKLPDSKKRLQQANKVPPFAPTDFSKLPNKVLPMLPLYGIPTQPGLIPTVGMFPTAGLSNFPHNKTNAMASSLLLQGLMPFSNLKQASTEKLYSQEKIQSSAKVASNAFPDRTYCNVAPLVPESMQILPPELKSESKQDNLFERDYSIIPKLLHPPHTLQENEMHCLKTETPTGAGEHQSEDKDKGRRRNMNLKQNDPSSFTMVKNMKTAQFSNCSIDSFRAETTATSYLNADAPIEVSDDSTDNTPKPFALNTAWPTPKCDSPTINKSLAEATMKNIIEVPEESLPQRDPKKYKKTKSFKNTQIVNSSAFLPLNIFGSERESVGRLAGGADLIPVSDTGLAYSSKTIPFTSLTAASTFMSTSTNERDQPANIFESLTITPAPSTIDLQKRRKEHKKLKKLKEGKIKKKKDKKEKTKSKVRADKLFINADKVVKEKELEKHKCNNKELLKKIKKDKKKSKQRVADTPSLLSFQNIVDSENNTLNLPKPNIDKLPVVSSLTSSVDTLTTFSALNPSVIPKLTLKLGGTQSPSRNEELPHKVLDNAPSTSKHVETREPSPELARISPLITRPPKQKNTSDQVAPGVYAGGLATAVDSNITSESLSDNSKVTPATDSGSISNPSAPPPSPWLSGGTLTASSVLLPQQLLQTTKGTPPEKPPAGILGDQEQIVLLSETSRPSSYIDAEGNRVWICPACGKVDDGSAMIGCDGCDAWYHWVCVGIFVAPKDNEDWFCRVCITRRKAAQSSDKRRKRNKKNKPMSS